MDVIPVRVCLPASISIPRRNAEQAAQKQRSLDKRVANDEAPIEVVSRSKDQMMIIFAEKTA